MSYNRKRFFMEKYEEGGVNWMLQFIIMFKPFRLGS
jgi:hypothetical protein